MAALIAENSYLIPNREKERYAAKNKYLMIVTDLDSELNQNNNEVVLKIDMLKKNAFHKIERIGGNLLEIDKTLKKQEKKIEDNENHFRKVVHMVS
jgi:hypothetical protein